MASEVPVRKRKASVGEQGSDDEFADDLLEGILSESDDADNDSEWEDDDSEEHDESESEESEEDEEIETAHSDGMASDADKEEAIQNLLRDAAESAPGVNQDELDEEQPNYTVSTDANGNVRYVYNEIDPVYDSDDTDNQEPANTIGNIPLSFYDSYPHIGYDINGKKIMRPATGEALDALLDSIEVPKGWTGLTDPATGKPLNLSQEELELLRRVQMNEIPEEGYDPYPVRVLPSKWGDGTNRGSRTRWSTLPA